MGRRGEGGGAAGALASSPLTIWPGVRPSSAANSGCRVYIFAFSPTTCSLIRTVSSVAAPVCRDTTTPCETVSADARRPAAASAAVNGGGHAAITAGDASAHSMCSAETARASGTGAVSLPSGGANPSGRRPPSAHTRTVHASGGGSSGSPAAGGGAAAAGSKAPRTKRR